jgi:hypothetical protein
LRKPVLTLCSPFWQKFMTQIGPKIASIPPFDLRLNEAKPD